MELLDNERLEAKTKALTNGLKELKTTDPSFGPKMDSLAKLAESINHSYSAAEEARANAENERLKAEELEIEKAKTEEEARANAEAEKLKKIDIAATIGGAVLTAGTQFWAFLRATKKEADEAFLTVTDRTTVTEVLKRGFRFIFRK